MRKKKKKRLLLLLVFLCLCLAGLAVLTRFADFGKGGKEKKTVWNDGAMLRIGDTQVDYREGMIYLQAVKEEYEQYYGSDIWMYAIDGRGNTVAELLKEQILEQIIYIKVVCKQANTLGIVLSEEELFHVEEQTKEYMEKIAGSDLVLYGINEDIVRRIYTDGVLARKTFEQVTLNVDNNISNEEAGQHRLYTIALRNYKIDASGSRVSYSREETEELRARMEELHDRARTTDDFYKLAESITENSAMLEMTVGHGDLPSDYEEQVLALKDGEVSDIIESEDYYYLFYCVNALDVDATHKKKEEIIAARQEEEFRARYEEWRTELKIEVNEEVWDAIGFHTSAEG